MPHENILISPFVRISDFKKIEF